MTRLQRWTADALRSSLAEPQAFATKLRQELPAVAAALTRPYSHGQTEGPITRLTALKPQMSGRANFDLLRKRFLTTTPAGASP
jgi:transposase